MRLVKLTGLLSSVAAVAVMALAVAPASATVLCNASEETCKSENQYLSGTVITASLAEGTSAVLISGFQRVTCTGSTPSNKTETGTPLAGTLTSLSQSGCSNNLGQTCTAATVGLPAESSVSHGGSGNGTLSLEGVTIEYVCGSFTCRYGASPLNLTMTGGNPASLSANEVVVERQSGSSGICSVTAKLSATYTVSSPKPVFVSNGTAHTGTGTALCKEQVNPCPVASRYTEGQSIKGTSTNVSFTNVFGTFWSMTCNNGSLEGQVGGVSGASVAATISNLSATGCSNNSGQSCSATFTTPMSEAFTTSTVPNGTLTVGELEVKFTCGATVCRYGSSGEASLPVQGGSPATLTASGLPLEKREVSSALCASWATMSGTFSLNTPSPLYLEASA